MSDIPVLEFDAIIIGGGGSGMRTALQLAESGYKTAVISKVFPTRSHTVSAQGGITCAIASDDPNDDWRWHMYDTVKGSDYIGDQDAIEYMCSVGPEAVYELDYSNQDPQANSDTHSDAYANCDAYQDSDAYGDSFAYSHAYSKRHSDCDSNRYVYADGFANAYCQPDANIDSTTALANLNAGADAYANDCA